MKKVLFLSFAALAVIFSGCGKISQLANINVTIPYTQQVTVPQIPGDTTSGTAIPGGGVTLPFPAFPVPTNVQQYVSQYKTSTSKIVSFDLSSMQAAITAPAGANFNFMDSIQLYISASGQPEVLVAYQYTIPKGETTLALDVTPNLNLKNYFITDTMYFRVNTHINAVPASGTQLTISSSFNLVANPLD